MKLLLSTPKVDPVVKGACLGWRPPTRLTPWEWAEHNVKIANSERSTRYDARQLPWVKAPMECWGDSMTRQIVCPWPTGAGKSTMAEGCIPYSVSEDPGPMMYLSQTDEDAKFWVETRLKPALKSVPSVADLWPEDRHQSRKLEIIFPHMPFVSGGANQSNTQEKSMRGLWGDECIFWKPGVMRDFLARHHNRWNRKVMLVSQGGIAGIDTDEGGVTGGDEFWQEWMKSDRCEFSWKCTCGEAQAFAFESLKYDTITRGSKGLDEQATAETARLVCRDCGKEHPDEVQTRRRLASSNMLNGSLGYIATNSAGLKHIRGFHVDSLAIWWVPWAQEVLEFLEAKRLAKTGITEKLRQWHQKRRARFWSDDMSDSQIAVTRGDFTKLDHEDGLTIDGEVRRFATADAGGDHYWMTVAAWKQGGSMRVLWEGYIPSDGGDEVEMKRICDQYNVPLPQTFIDIGYQQDRILDLCVKHGWTGIKGDGIKRHFLHPREKGKSLEKLYSPIKRARAKSGGIARFIFIASNEIKDILARMLASGDQIELPADVSKPFENHMKCERRTVEKHAKTGEEKAIWIRPGSKANHLWDCMCYQVGAALAFRVFDD